MLHLLPFVDTHCLLLIGIVSFVAAIAANDDGYPHFQKFDHTIVNFGSRDLFTWKATKHTCLKECERRPDCVGVDYGLGHCYGKANSLGDGKREHPTKFTHYEKIGVRFCNACCIVSSWCLGGASTLGDLC